jgi:glucan biosynthesis protein
MPIAPGRSFDCAVRINLVDREGTHALPFHKEWFDLGSDDLSKRIPLDLGYARSNNPPAKPGAFALPAPQRGLIALEKASSFAAEPAATATP